MLDVNGLDPFGSGQGQVVGYCEHSNEASGFNKCGKLICRPRKY